MKNNRRLRKTIGLSTIVLAGMFAMSASNLGHGRPAAGGETMVRGGMGRGGMRGMMHEMMSGVLPPGVRPDQLPDPDGPGAKLLAFYCDQCHNLPSPKMHTAEEWPRVVGRMLERARRMSGMMMMRVNVPTQKEEGTLVDYLKENAMEGLPPGAAPAPDSPGAALFQQTCSQCHALPDPKQHGPSEWPAVVERMRSNMQAMGKRVITEDEKKEIEAYLTRRAE
jgi:cytochrome c5